LGDRVRIREIFTNLIGNAIKYNDKAERWVEIGYIEPHETTSLPLLASDTPAVRNQTIYYVRDNGIGIAVKHRARCWHLQTASYPRCVRRRQRRRLDDRKAPGRTARRAPVAHVRGRRGFHVLLYPGSNRVGG
jgi:hypothetical protein